MKQFSWKWLALIWFAAIAVSGIASQSARAGELVKSEPEAKPSWTEHVKIKGDFRYRFELIDLEDKDLRYRHRVRGRLGAHAQLADSLKVVLQLGTGGSDDPVSNNQSLTDAFSSKPIWLDLAYFDWRPDFGGGLFITGGKMKNPLVRVGKSELLWDPDLNPEGLALGYKHSFSMVEPFLTSVGYWVQERKAADDTWLLGLQGGLKIKLLDGGLYILAGGGYYNYLHLQGKPLLWDGDSYGNSTVEVMTDPADPDSLESRYAHDYNEVDGFLEVGGKIAGMPWAVFGDVGANLAVDEDNLGWLAGAVFGQTKKPFDFKVRYIYRQVEKDAVFGLFTDSDFVGGGADGKGHEANFSFQLSKRVTTAITYFYNQKALDDPLDFHRAQFDLKFKF